MTRQKLLLLAGVTAVLLAAGIWLSAHRAAQQSEQDGGILFADLKPALAQISEIRLSKGDGSRATLRKTDGGWLLAERNYPADGARVRDLLLGLAAMKVVETKTSDPANYSKLGVEAPSPTAASTLLEVVAGEKTWALIVGKGTGGRTLFVRKPESAASALAEPVVTADTDQKPWLDRMLAEIPGADVHEIEVRPANGPAYTLTRAQRGGEFALTPVPKSRKPATPDFASQGETLSSLFLDEVRPVPDSAPTATDHAVFRTFDGQVVELSGHRDVQNAKAYIALAVRRDADLAARFAPAVAPPAPAAVTPAAAANGPAAPDAVPAAPAAAVAPAIKPSAKTVERLAGRVTGVEYEIPIYKYDTLFKPHEEVLEPLPGKKP